MKHWLYVSAIRGRMMEYYLIPCSKRSDVLTTVDSFSGSIVDANRARDGQTSLETTS